MTVESSISRDRIAVVAVPLLLIVVALVQIGRAALLDQSSYAGFGFGMFATYENELSRWTEVSVIDADGIEFAVAPDPDLDLAALEVPTAGNLARLAADVLTRDPSFVTVRAAIWTVAVTGLPMQLERVLLIDSLVERSP